jgi:trimethylamine--corrinoid protein Co-methyltransferase
VLLEDVARAARLCDALPNIDFVMTYASPSDVQPQRRYLEGFQAMATNTAKPFVVTAEGEDDLRAMWRAGCEVRGGEERLRRMPYFVAYVQPVSPLSHTSESMDKLLFCSDAGIPATYNPAPLAGATAPITAAGHATQALAEALFGMVVMQLRRPGAPYLLGTGSGVIDLATGQCCYDPPENLAVYLSLVEIAKWLDMPNWGYAGTSDSESPDLQAGIEAGKQTLLSMLFGSNLNHDIAYLDKGITGALEMIVVLDECIASDRRLLGGLAVSAETLALDVIESVGPGGEFLACKHTRRNMRTAQWRPGIFNRFGYKQWEEAGSLDLREVARRKAQELLKTHQPEAMDPQVAKRIGAIVAEYQPT